MTIGEVIGTVTLGRSHPSLTGARFRLVVPLSLENLQGSQEPRAEALVVYDELAAGVGALIAFTEGGEAVQPFYPDDKPIDAYNAAVLDAVDLVRPA
ncbi:MAG: carbon dioxide concentrating mechanism protein CcmL [Pirellulales bacterium]|nr:carbon dioxide concentrating mechanism protein CcmL [Pirellulales bacterium]